jgi:AraC-like DNA-binding protein
VQEPYTVAVSYLRTLLEVTEAAGIGREALLDGLPITEKELAAAGNRVGLNVASHIWKRAIALSGDVLLGLKVGCQVRPSTFYVLGHAVMSSATLGEAMQLMLRYQRLVSDGGVLTSDAAEMHELVTIIYTPRVMRLSLMPQQIEAIIASLIHMAAWLSASHAKPSAISFTHAPLAPVDAYRSLLGVSPTFCASAHSITFARADLAQALPHADADLCAMHCRLIDEQLTRLPQADFLSGFVVQWLAARPLCEASAEGVAAQLGASVRTLQRRLAEEGSSWETLLDEARRQEAQRLILAGTALDEAAQQLGYHDASSLSRAMRRWFGVTPGKMRRQPTS